MTMISLRFDDAPAAPDPGDCSNQPCRPNHFVMPGASRCHCVIECAQHWNLRRIGRSHRI